MHFFRISPSTLAKLHLFQTTIPIEQQWRELLPKIGQIQDVRLKTEWMALVVAMHLLLESCGCDTSLLTTEIQQEVLFQEPLPLALSDTNPAETTLLSSMGDSRLHDPRVLFLRSVLPRKYASDWTLYSLLIVAEIMGKHGGIPKWIWTMSYWPFQMDMKMKEYQEKQQETGEHLPSSVDKKKKHNVRSVGVYWCCVAVKNGVWVTIGWNVGLWFGSLLCMTNSRIRSCCRGCSQDCCPTRMYVSVQRLKN